MNLSNDRLKQQIEFIVEIDKLKHVFRKSKLMDRSRYENDAEHTWHLAVMAIILSEHVDGIKPDLHKVIRLLLVHDIVEIDAGDTFAYDVKGNEDKEEREQAAAKRIFGLLPDDQAKELHALWREFEERQTIEAQYASALDRLQPLLHNYYTGGESWRKYGVTSTQVINRNQHIRIASEKLWEFALSMIHESVEKGYLLP